MADSPSNEQRLFRAVQDVYAVLKPLKADGRERVLATVGAFFGAGDSPVAPVAAPKAPKAAAKRPAAPAPKPAAAAKVPQAAASGDAPSPKAFMAEKKPATDVERVACLAYYLTHHRDTKQFKAGDIRALAEEAGEKPFSNTMTSVNNTTRAGFLGAVSRGNKRLSATGKRYVEKLPDRAAAKAGKPKAAPQGKKA